MKHWRSLLPLLMAGFVALGLSAFVSVQFLPDAYSQDEGFSELDEGLPPPEDESPNQNSNLVDPMPRANSNGPLPSDPNMKLDEASPLAQPGAGQSVDDEFEEEPQVDANGISIMPEKKLPQIGVSVDPSGELPPFDPGGYFPDFASKRNPFQPTPEVRNVRVTETRVEVPLEPLQRFELSEIKVLGILWDIKEPRAMVADPSGKVHIVKQEQKIGRKNGVLALIREGELVVVESQDPGTGKLDYSTKVLAIGR